MVKAMNSVQPETHTGGSPKRRGAPPVLPVPPRCTTHRDGTGARATAEASATAGRKRATVL
jgi:hypothetical protein